MASPRGLCLLGENRLSLYSVFLPANGVSGDLCDFFMVDHKHMVIAIGDATGSGYPAALFTGVAHIFIKYFSAGQGVKKVVSRVNDELCRNNRQQTFITLFLGLLDIESGVLTYCNAGHTPGYLLRCHGTPRLLSQSHGLPLGLYTGRPYGESTLRLYPGDKLVLCTDGITEQSNDAGQYFGAEQLQTILYKNRKESAEHIAGSIMQQLEKFRGTDMNTDDISLLIVGFSHSTLRESPSPG